MSTPTRDHLRIDGADALLDQITAALAGQSPATGVLARIGDRLARGTAALDLAAARRASISSGRSVVIAHRPGGPAPVASQRSQTWWPSATTATPQVPWPWIVVGTPGVNQRTASRAPAPARSQ